MFMLAAGAGVAMYLHAPIPIETGIAASVLAPGLLVALARQLPMWFSAAVAALFGLLYGYAHGLELPESAPAVAYAAGFFAATAARISPALRWVLRRAGISRCPGSWA